MWGNKQSFSGLYITNIILCWLLLLADNDKKRQTDNLDSLLINVQSDIDGIDLHIKYCAGDRIFSLQKP